MADRTVDNVDAMKFHPIFISRLVDLRNVPCWIPVFHLWRVVDLVNVFSGLPMYCLWQVVDLGHVLLGGSSASGTLLFGVLVDPCFLLFLNSPMYLPPLEGV